MSELLFHIGIEEDDIDKIKIALKSKNVKPEKNNNFAILIACNKQSFKAVDFLINFTKADPSANNNLALLYAFNNKNKKIINLLWNDIRVKKSLKNNNIELYNEMIRLKISIF
jgi:hypothetical protein